MKIFISGGSGFIGRNLKEQLAGKYEIHAPGREELDLLDPEKVRSFLKDHHFDIVIHCATWNATRNSKKDTAKILENNLRMFFNLARCCGDFGRLINFGSGQEYDREHWIPKMKEEYFDMHVPQDQAGFSRYLIGRYVALAHNIVNLRPFAVFGKYEDWEIRFISNACCKAVWDLPITIKKNVFYDYLYIDDLVKITNWFIQNRPKEKVYNICTGRTYDLLTLAKKVLKVSGKNLEIKIAQPGIDKEYSGDNARLFQEMGSVSFEDIDHSISALYEWYKIHKKDINRELLLKDK
ncbi:MAG TPA: NAD(P)-dependent oxidoreductase [Candidatus Omnitrophota bacterium]|nr:NAD(P)-dependent oxidoreductase [Candidatus Omnitrophota bacterium]